MESPVLEDLCWLKFEAPIFEGLVSGVIAALCGGGFDFRLDDRSEWSHFAFSAFFNTSLSPSVVIHRPLSGILKVRSYWQNSAAHAISLKCRNATLMDSVKPSFFLTEWTSIIQWVIIYTGQNPIH